jgi:hypothetical protein
MKRPTEVLPELIIATLSASLWFTPKELTLANVAIGKLLRATGYSASVVFYGKSYLLLLLNQEKFRTVQEKELIEESADVELFTFRKSAEVEKEKLKIKRELMEVAAPNFQRMYELEVESTPKPPEHPELTEQQKLSGARAAIEQALAPTVVQPKFTEEDIRKEFPESMDGTYWKAILSAMQNGHTKEDIVRDVLQCSGSKLEVGKVYFAMLLQKFT